MRKIWFLSDETNVDCGDEEDESTVEDEIATDQENTETDIENVDAVDSDAGKEKSIKILKKTIKHSRSDEDESDDQGSIGSEDIRRQL